jgi:hypothetical protein
MKLHHLRGKQARAKAQVREMQSIDSLSQTYAIRPVINLGNAYACAASSQSKIHEKVRMHYAGLIRFAREKKDMQCMWG